MKLITSICLDGLGRMGSPMAKRLRKNGIHVTGYDLFSRESDVPSLEAMVNSMPAGERVIWLMLPGPAYEGTLDELAGLLDPFDMIIDGGNTQWQVTQARNARFNELGVRYVDVGTSGGIFGRRLGYALMVGSTNEEFEALRPVLEALAPRGGGLVHAGPSGAGHFVKEVHNGIEYGIMAAFAEGFAMLSASPLVPDPTAVFASWRRGSIVSGFLLNRVVDAVKDPKFSKLRPVGNDSGEGQWTIQDALTLRVPVPVIYAAFTSRLASQGRADVASRVIAGVRNKFGGHEAETKD